MSDVIWKFGVFPPEGNDTLVVIPMPEGAEVLWADVQTSENGMDLPYLWAVVDPSAPLVDRHFHVVATGQHFKRRGKIKVGMVTLRQGYLSLLVFHIFEEQRGKLS